MDQAQREQRIQTVCLLILAAVAIAVVLLWLRSVMIPFVLAVFIAFGLSPLIDVQIRYVRAPRPLAVLVTLVVGFVMLGLLGGMISTSVGQLAANAEAYQEQLRRLLGRMAAALPLEQFSPQLEAAVASLTQRSLQIVGLMLAGTTNAILGILSQGLLVLLFLVFLLLGGTTQTQRREGVWNEIESRIEHYILTKILVSAATGLLVGAILMSLGIDLALVFGLFAFLLNFIPSVGSIIATLLPVPVVLVSPEVSGLTAVLAIALPALVQFSIGNVVEPKIMGESLDLHPVTIIIALMFWGALWGITGMLLATPITAVLKILFERLEVTAPVAELLAGRLDALKSA
jgi:AI-2 transport protein TqsA